jgi:hypothetical protein
MPICVAGMPHSGMSMIGRALGGLGVDLGPDSEARFARINAAVLETIGAAWNSPPAGDGSWTVRPELESLKREARTVSDALALAEPWGWADSASSLTLPFWRELFPDLQTLVCVRHPLELAAALEAEGTGSHAEALELWQAYYGAIDMLGERNVVTHFSLYCDDAHAELERIARALHLAPSSADLSAAAAMIEAPAADGSPSDADLPGEVRQLYERLLAHDAQPSRPDPIAEQKLELAHLRRELERASGQIEDLRAQVDAHAGWQRERDELLANLEEQLLERDEELSRAYEENEWRSGTESSLREENEWLREQEHEARHQLDSMQRTRLWQLGTGYWSLKARVRHRLRRAR